MLEVKKLEYEAEKSKKGSTSRKISIAILTILIVAATIFITYYFTSNSASNKYINALYKQKQNIDKANNLVAQSIKNLSNLGSKNKEELTKIINTISNAEAMIASSIENIKKITPPAQHKTQFNTFLQGVTQNKRIFTQTRLILSNTKSNSLNNAINSLYKYVSDTSKFYESSKLKKAYISLPNEILTLPDKVHNYASKMYSEYENKSRLLEQYNSYFNAMNGIVLDFQNEKVDLGNNLELIKNDQISFEEVYIQIEKKLAKLDDLLNSYNNLTVPANLATQHQKFNEIIKSYTYYCQDFKSLLTKFEGAQGNEAMLKEVNEQFNALEEQYKKISQDFTSYLDKYHGDEAFYTDINNL
jgi:hypothetical protein